jgi:hypothetical protein
MTRSEKVRAFAIVIAALDAADVAAWRAPQYVALAQHVVECLDPTVTTVYAAQLTPAHTLRHGGRRRRWW